MVPNATVAVGLPPNCSRNLCCGFRGEVGGCCATATAAAAEGNRLPLNEVGPVDDRMLDGPAWLPRVVDDTIEDGELRSHAEDSVNRRVADDSSDSADVRDVSPVHPDSSAAARDTGPPERDAPAGTRSFERLAGDVGASEGVLSGIPVVTGGAHVCRVPCGIISDARGACAMSLELALLTRCHASVNPDTTAPPPAPPAELEDDWYAGT